MVYEISFKRLNNEVPMKAVLRRPFANEVEDYNTYKRQRHAVREARDIAVQAATALTSTPILTVSSAGLSEEVLEKSSLDFGML